MEKKDLWLDLMQAFLRGDGPSQDHAICTILGSRWLVLLIEGPPRLVDANIIRFIGTKVDYNPSV